MFINIYAYTTLPLDELTLQYYFSPIMFLNSSNLDLPRGLVNMSTIMSLVGQYSNLTVPLATVSRIT